MRIVVTGHRPQKLEQTCFLETDFYYAIARGMRSFILERIEEAQKTGDKVVLITGMALGMDILFGLVGVKLKKEYPSIVQIECFIPFLNHKPKAEYSKKKYETILASADRIIYTTNEPYELEGKKRPWLMEVRNRRMVDELIDDKDVVLAAWVGDKPDEVGQDGSIIKGEKDKGGTANCVHYAISKDKTIFRLDPFDQSLTLIHESIKPIVKLFNDCDQDDLSEDDYNWTKVLDFDLSKMGDPAEWIKWINEEQDQFLKDHGYDRYKEIEESWLPNTNVEPIIVVKHPDKGFYTWDGAHRVGIAIRHGLNTVPAYVGVRK